MTDPASKLQELIEKMSHMHLSDVQKKYQSKYCWRCQLESILPAHNNLMMGLGLAEAAKAIRKSNDAYCTEYGQVDPESGCWEATKEQESWACALDEAEGIILAISPDATAALEAFGAEVERKARLNAFSRAERLATLFRDGGPEDKAIIVMNAFIAQLRVLAKDGLSQPTAPPTEETP